MRNDLIYMINTGASSVLENGIVPLPTIARRSGCAIQSTDGQTITLRKPGYYAVKGTITFTAPVAGLVTLILNKNSVAIPGIVTSGTVTTATTEVNTLAIEGIIRVTCGEAPAGITLSNTGVAITTSNVSLDVIYLG